MKEGTFNAFYHFLIVALNHNEEGHVVNPLISFRSWGDYLKYKDMDRPHLYAIMKEREKEQRETDRRRRAVEKATSSTEFDNIVETELQRIIQTRLDKE